MADLLILLPDIDVANPGHPGAWEPGMVVDVFPDGQLGPGSEQHPRFFVVRVPDATVEGLTDLVEAVEEDDIVIIGQKNLVKRRANKMGFAGLNPPTMTAITVDRDITVSEAALRTYVDRYVI